MKIAPMRIALAQYPIGQFATLADWQAHLDAWVRQAADAGAQMLLFPEYGSMELASLLAPAVQSDLLGSIAAMQDLLPAYRQMHADAAKRYGVTIIAGSFPVRLNDGGFINRAFVYAPDGREACQDKRQMTRFEREEWIIQGGAALHVFDLPSADGADGIRPDGARFGIAICYDIEFPLIARALAEAGADLVLAPSCTDTLAGLHRVHVGARARALESQIYVAVAQTVGEAPWSPAVDVNRGLAAAYATPDRGFPDDGVLAQGEIDKLGWVYADLDFVALKAARASAQVFTRADWTSQHLPGLVVQKAEFR